MTKVYACVCGYQTAVLANFRRHFFSAKKEPGKHKSLGIIDVDTGEVILPPYYERTSEQLASSRHNLPAFIPREKPSITIHLEIKMEVK